jgi:hypothetical protein
MRGVLRGLGLVVVCVAAVVASFSTLASLAAFTGWGERSSWLLPASLDALGMTSCLVWLDGKAPERARRYAAWTTWVAAGLSIIGNGVGHLAATGHLSQGLLLVVLVGAVPPAALATVVHLIVVVTTTSPVAISEPIAAAPPAAAEVKVQDAPGPAKPKTTKPRPKPKAKASPVRDRSDEDLMAEAREANRLHHEQYGQPISLNRLRPALRISRSKASDVHRLLMEEVA